jgi:CBS domain-containing protein
VAQGRVGRDHKVTVAEIMIPDPLTVSPDTPTVEAIRLMRDHQLACLPVTRDNRLVGIVTEHDLIIVASRLLEAQLDGTE